ncbi:hypothetical protein BMR1_02g01760 [Babesia microti strain RI]|uniref:Uncharacterized protein n=1 Tax=Babesia microti (strain RI) TaxID=1133968 RepID=I7IQ54_BABMR|nr:hypothetical protein BMR1_02g01760 [Babesia microti strain RI]CCF73510.1 hypothetical protein BMR1_02g01760 [Babesia microti strain RI]|eukprot:XP_012648119.1 hypothetical protein BMR1_02g01760 [Babesia microti strain RI]
MHINYKLIITGLVSIALATSITLAVIYLPNRSCPGNNGVGGGSGDNNSGIIPNDPHPCCNNLRQKPQYQTKPENELVNDDRDLNFNKIRGGKQIITFTVPSIDDLKNKRLSDSEFILSEKANPLISSGDSKNVIVFEVKNDNEKLMGSVEVGQWEVTITTSCIRRIVIFDSNEVSDNIPMYIYIVDYFEGGNSTVSKFFFANNRWNADFTNHTPNAA